MEKSMTAGLSREQAHVKIFLNHYYPAEDHEVIVKQGSYAEYLLVLTTLPLNWHKTMVDYIHSNLEANKLSQPFILTQQL